MVCPTALARCFGKNVDRFSRQVTEHLWAVHSIVAEQANPAAILNAGLTYMRCANGGKVMIYTTCPPNEMTEADVEALSKFCDGKEKNANRQAKRFILDAVHHATRGKPIHIYDIGCGKQPILNHIKDTSHVAFTGIDVLNVKMQIPETKRHAVTNADLLPISWNRAVNHTPAKAGHIPVCTASYSAHFFKPAELASGLDRILDVDGIFIGNLYMPGTQQERRRALDAMRGGIETTELDYDFIMDGNHNAYFVISGPDNAAVIDRALGSIEESLSR